MFDVVRTFQREADDILVVSAGETAIEVTPEHPFYVENVGWVEAADLKPGDILVTMPTRGPPSETGTGEHGPLTVESVTPRPSAATVYNFEVAGAHTYYVSDARALVHNTCRVTEVPETLGRNHVQDILNIKRQKGLGDIPAGTRADAEILGNAWVNGAGAREIRPR